MNAEIEFVQRLVRHVLIQLGDKGPDWRIGDIGYLQIGGVLTSDEPTNIIEASLESLSGTYSPVVTDFTVDAPFINAVLEVASQIQDHAAEATHGASVPPCPGHKHPATADLVEGRPKWVCMQQGADYYAVDILPNLGPSHTLEAYMRENPAHPSSA